MAHTAVVPLWGEARQVMERIRSGMPPAKRGESSPSAVAARSSPLPSAHSCANSRTVAPPKLCPSRWTGFSRPQPSNIGLYVRP